MSRSLDVALSVVFLAACTQAPVDPARDAALAPDAAAHDAAIDTRTTDDAGNDAAPVDDAALDAPSSVAACDRTYANGDVCAFAENCSETIGSGCMGTCFCTPGAGALCTYAYSAACLAYFCPAAPPARGTPADPPPTLLSGPSTSVDFACDYGTSDCPVHCTIGADSTSPTDYAWSCTTPAGPTCPASDCPATLDTTCAWPSDLSCSFAGSNGCRFDCFCDASPTCIARNCECPTTQPGGSESCPADPYRAVCDYVAPTGESIECTCGIFIATSWQCSAPSVACPSAPPSDTCRAGIDPTSCTYATPPYCGHCGCDATGHWACSASSCDMCPGSPPADRSACTSDQIGQICDYGGPGTPGGHCACVGPSPTWSCA